MKKDIHRIFFVTHLFEHDGRHGEIRRISVLGGRCFGRRPVHSGGAGRRTITRYDGGGGRIRTGATLTRTHHGFIVDEFVAVVGDFVTVAAARSLPMILERLWSCRKQLRVSYILSS